MALPTLTKTWNFDVNLPGSAPGANQASFDKHYFDLKESLINISPGWSVVGSGGLGAGGGGGMDATDRWTVSTDLQNTVNSPTSGNSWVVLQNNAIKTGFQILFGPRKTSGGWFGGELLRMSPGGLYTGGAQQATPTATDEITLLGGNRWVDGDTPAPRINVAMSSDGESTRIWLMAGGVSRALYIFEKPANTVSGWTDPWIATAISYNAASVIGEYGDLANTDIYTFSTVGSTTMKLYWTSEAWNVDATSAAAGQRLTTGNDLDGGAFSMAPIGLASETGAVRGRHGELTDIWWGSTSVPDGGHYPDTLPRQFVQIGHIIMPWDQTASGLKKTV